MQEGCFKCSFLLLNRGQKCSTCDKNATFRFAYLHVCLQRWRLNPRPLSVTYWNVGRDMGSGFQTHSAASHEPILATVVVLPMSPLPWKHCIKRSGKAGCPLLIRRQGGRSLFFSSLVFLPYLPLFFSLSSTLLPIHVKAAGALPSSTHVESSPPSLPHT